MARREDSTDPRAVRTRELLISACTELLRENRSEALSVSRMVKAAGVSRQVFYEHFESRDALLYAVGNAVIVEPMERYAQRVRVRYGDDNNIKQLVAEVAPDRDVVLNILRGPADAAIFAHVREVLLQPTIDLLNGSLAVSGRDVPEDHKRWTAEFLIAGILSSLVEALRAAQGAEETARRINAVTSTLDAMRLSGARGE